MKTLLSVTLAVLMSLTPVLASMGVGPTPAVAQGAQRGAFTIPLTTTAGHPANLTINRFIARDGQIIALANLSGYTPDGRFVAGPVEVPMTATTQSVAAATAQVTQQQATCPILNLVINPIHLDLLGLVVDLPNPLVINIFAEPGPGNLLGNLLCAITGLLDGTGAVTGALQQVVAALNNLIAALGNV